MNNRPRLVQDAIHVEGNGLSVGHYEWYTVHTAFQPIYALTSKGWALYGVEGLARPLLDDRIIPPPAFFDGIPDQDAIFIDMMCRALQIRNFVKFQGHYPHLFINLNTQIYTDLAEMLYQFEVMAERIKGLGIDPSTLICEIIETKESSRQILRQIIETLRKHDIRVAVDDFGSDYSNLARVLDVEPDVVKLDRVWANSLLEHDPKKLERTIRDFLSSGITVLYEGVETSEQLSFAEINGCHHAQGFFLSRPFIPTLQDENDLPVPAPLVDMRRAG